MRSFSKALRQVVSTLVVALFCGLICSAVAFLIWETTESVRVQQDQLTQMIYVVELQQQQTRRFEQEIDDLTRLVSERGAQLLQCRIESQFRKEVEPAVIPVPDPYTN